MSVFITFAAALLIFGAVIAIHEFGHFAVAKLCGVQVNEFSIGMVRPAPLCTSSAISMIPCSSHSARKRCIKAGVAA